MQRPQRRYASSILIAAALGGIIWVSAGDLNPPAGPVAPTMKPLTEVEPRIAVNATNTPGDATALFKITGPGSYYLTGNIAGVAGRKGISIAADHVTLDLNGFTMDGGAVAATAIALANSNGVVIRNGFIANWSSDSILGETAVGVRIEGLHVGSIGGDNVRLGPGATIVDTTVTESQWGLQAGGRARIVRCRVSDATSTAVSVSGGSTVEGCVLLDNTGTAIGVTGAGSLIRNNHCRASGVYGIRVAGPMTTDNRIEGNDVTGGGTGLSIATPGNSVVDNTVRGNTTNYDFVTGNQLSLLIGEIPETIDWPASVTLTGSLPGVSGENGISVNADDVTIDLNGFSLIGVAGSLSGIAVLQDVTNLAVRNGALRNWGSYGVAAISATNSQFTNLLASGNGGRGLSIGSGAVVRQCTATGNGEFGIVTGVSGTVVDCTAQDNAGYGISVSTGSTARGCSAYSNDGRGISTAGGCTILSSTVAENGDGGIFANHGSTVHDCTAYTNTGIGIETTTSATVTGCTANANTMTGIAVSTGSTVQHSTARDNDEDGIIVESGSTVAGCTSSRNTGNGIQAEDDCLIVGNNCAGNGFGTGDGAGIFLGSFFVNGTRVEGNNVVNNDRGIDVDDAGNIIIRNTATDNGTNYDIVAGNSVGPVINVAGVGDISGTAGAEHPWANFEY